MTTSISIKTNSDPSSRVLTLQPRKGIGSRAGSDGFCASGSRISAHITQPWASDNWACLESWGTVIERDWMSWPKRPLEGKSLQNPWREETKNSKMWKGLEGALGTSSNSWYISCSCKGKVTQIMKKMEVLQLNLIVMNLKLKEQMTTVQEMDKVKALTEKMAR